MEIWSLWLIVITSFLSLSLLLSFYFITKSRHHAEAQVIEKAMKQNEQIQHSISMTTGNFMKKPPHQMQRDLSESFIDLGKDHSAVAIASTTNILDKSRVRVMGDLIPKSDRDRDRSIDLLLANSGRNGIIH